MTTTPTARHLLVLSTGNPLLERALLARGHRVSLVVPATIASQQRRENPDIEVWGISDWGDDDSLAKIAAVLPSSIDTVATIDEQAIRAAAVLRAALGLPGQDVASATASTDKARMKDRLAEAGIPVAAHRIVQVARAAKGTGVADIPSAAEELGWPVVVKPRAGVGTVATFRLAGPDDLDAALARGAFDTVPSDPGARFTAGSLSRTLHEQVGGFLVERALDVVAEYSCDTYIHDGEPLLSVPVRFEAPLLQIAGGGWHHTLLDPASPHGRIVADLALRATRAINVTTGVTHTEVLCTSDGQWWLGEIGARPGGAGIVPAAALAYGFDPPCTLAALSLGERPVLPNELLHRDLTTVLLGPPPGIVRRVRTGEQIAALPGVLDVDLHLAAGQPTPLTQGSMGAGGRIVLIPTGTAPIAEQVKELIVAVGLELDPPAWAAAA